MPLTQRAASPSQYSHVRARVGQRPKSGARAPNTARTHSQVFRSGLVSNSENDVTLPELLSTYREAKSGGRRGSVSGGTSREDSFRVGRRNSAAARRGSGGLMQVKKSNAQLAAIEFGSNFTAKHSLSAADLRRQKAVGLLGALIAEHSGREHVPNDVLQTIASVCDMEDQEEELADALAEAERLWTRQQAIEEAGGIARNRQCAAAGQRAPRHEIEGTVERHLYMLDKRKKYAPKVISETGGPNGSPVRVGDPKPPGQVMSKVRSYIRRRPASAVTAMVKEDVVNLRRVLNEIQLIIPALKRLQAQHGLDPDTEAGQVACFGDVFMILDEDGSGGVDLEEFLAFGRRVGGESAKVFSKTLFHRIDRERTGEVNKDGFINVLFPAYAAKKQRQLEEQNARKKREIAAVRWEDEWHPDDLETVRKVFDRCDTDADGHVTFEDLQLVCKMDWPDAKTMVADQFQAQDRDHDGKLDFMGLCSLLKPGFDASRSRREVEQKFFFQHIKAGW